MKKITNFLKAYWWIWLILLIVFSLFLIFGTSKIVSFSGNILNIILFLGLIYVLEKFTWGRGQTKSWGIFRLLGLLGVLLFGFWFYLVLEDKKNLIEALDDSRFNFVSLGLFFSFLLFVLGEIFLYLDNLQKSIKNIEVSTKMTCPRCYGKGFVDLHDIKRLGKENVWDQGFCRYCDGEGEVDKGLTQYLDPLETEKSISWSQRS